MKLRYILFLLLYCSCVFSTRKQTWEVINATGLKDHNEEFKSMIFINDRTGFLFGTNSTDETILNKEFDQQNAIIYKTNDSGRSWIGKQICKGQFVDAFAMKNTIYALSNRSSKEYYAMIDTSVLFASCNSDNNWEIVFRFPYYIREIKFANPSTGIAITHNQHEQNATWRILETVDAGKNWQEIFQESTIKSPLFDNNGILWYLSDKENKQTLRRDYLLDSRRLKDAAIHIEAVPLNFEASQLATGNNNDLLLAGKENDKAVIYRRDKEGKYEKIKTFTPNKLFPEYINVHGNNITLIVGKIISTIVSREIFISKDYGKNWIEDNPASTIYMNPVAFNENNIWVYSGAATIQVRH